MSNSIKASSIVQTPRSATVVSRSASVVLGRPPLRDSKAGDTLSVASSRRESYCTEARSAHPPTVGPGPRSQWTSMCSDITSVSRRTPITHGKFRTDFSYRKAEVPAGYPKSDHMRMPRRESVVSEFSRKVFEGYDIWEDEDRPVINWKFPQMPIRSNKTHELRKIANLEKIKQMVEREKQMNKRNSRFAGTTDKKETAWWEKSKNGARNTPMSTPRYGANGNISYQNRTPTAGWTSNVSSRSSTYMSSRPPFVTPRRK